MYQLEVVSMGEKNNNQLPPILLVHGAWHDAGCWQQTFMPYLANEGWEVFALSLRGHGNSEGKKNIRWFSINHYVEDLIQTVAMLKRPPILVGHSMGGYVVQKYLEQHQAAGTVLLASVPPTGTLGFNLRILKKSPLKWLKANLLMRPSVIIESPDLAKYWFYSDDMSVSDLLRIYGDLQEESFRAALNMLMFKARCPARMQTPIAVLGAENDRIISINEVRNTAQAYQVEPVIFENMAHAMMIEKGWESVADWISNWGKSLAIEEGFEKKRKGG